MYQPPQTFLWEDSPPCSPQNSKLPTFEISFPSFMQDDEDKAKKEHKRWKSHSEKPKSRLPQPVPFSYEYQFRDGQLVGLAEFHGDNDYLHYSSSSRSSSRAPSRTPSTNVSPRTSTGERPSQGSDHSTRQPPPSPTKTDKLKRALSLTNMKSRSNLKDQKRRAPPVPSPEQPWSATFSATESPKHIKKPFELTPPHTPNRVFEEPRPAPQPPVRNSSNTTMQVAGPPTPKHSSEEPRSILKQTLPIERAFEGPRSRPVMMKSNSTLPIVTPIASIVTFDTSGKPRPPLRRKTSKFVEHIDTNPPNKEANGITQPLPLMPSVSFQLPILPVEKQSPQNVAIKRSATVASQPAKPLDHYERTYAGRSPRGTRFQSNVQEPEVGHSLTSVRLRQTLDHNSARKVSVSTTKPAITRVPIPAPVLKRASSMRTRPPTVWGDICMAEVKPVLMSPIVAVGHARMISC